MVRGEGPQRRKPLLPAAERGSSLAARARARKLPQWLVIFSLAMLLFFPSDLVHVVSLNFQCSGCFIRILQMFHMDVSKRLRCCICFTHMLQMCFLDVAFCDEGFECSHQHERDVTMFFSHFLMNH
jgi:hypothetical protein